MEANDYGPYSEEKRSRTRKPSARAMGEEEILMEALVADIEDTFPDNGAIEKLRDLTIMQFSVVFVAIALLASASLAMSAQVTGFTGAGCGGSVVFSNGVSSNECLTLGGGSVRSMSYSGVPSKIQFFASGGPHDSCTNGPQAVFGGGSGCSTAPDGFNWESVFVQ
ncbi:hypothetical protein B0H11DRAFT_2224425 [Mycena galericulata]|nr:hypothetical protein B0H11DRAFT_2224425 [Mycena galericulata]